MTISSTTVKNSYDGDGSTTTFTYQFKIFQDSDIQVIIRAANGTETTKTITTHYTVTGAGVSTGGSVIFTAKQILINSNTLINVSGDFGGGHVLIGGDWQGGQDIARRVY